jgi:hypothetical protein
MRTILVLGGRLEAGVTPGFLDDTYIIPVFELDSGRPRLLSIPRIATYVDRFRELARTHVACEFLVTCVGCGEGGYQPGQIADLFTDMPDNVYLLARLAYGLK